VQAEGDEDTTFPCSVLLLGLLSTRLGDDDDDDEDGL
jgi:hypothetical protein